MDGRESLPGNWMTSSPEHQIGMIGNYNLATRELATLARARGDGAQADQLRAEGIQLCVIRPDRQLNDLSDGAGLWQFGQTRDDKRVDLLIENGAVAARARLDPMMFDPDDPTTHDGYIDSFGAQL